MDPENASAKPIAESDPGETNREAMPVGQEGAPRLSFPVVGMGASAGGLEAFFEFFRVMPEDSGMAFVLVQHLPPDRESMMAEILSNRTRMPVHEVENGMPVEANHVYVIRPGQTMTIHDGALHLGEPVEKRGHSRPVDDFFRSLAEEQRERAICVIMSGMGSNGTAGAQVVKAVGGVCVAQEPETAKFPSMPRNLIDSGNADFVLRPEEIPQFLLRYRSHPYANRGPLPEVEHGPERPLLSEVVSVLRTRLRLDFSGYKKPTLLRRIQRRMGIHQIAAMSEYVRLLRRSPSEVSALSDDMMIHVTGFFRDPEVWEALREKVIVPLVTERPADSLIRAWVIACSSGEEAYTLGMLLLEEAEKVGKKFEIKIFATDTANRSLAHARAGIYPGGIESEISPERLERFFDRDDSVYRVRKSLRELVVFAPQNILQDPPFSRLDLCTCRNLLIYLEPEVQRRALSLMHYSLSEEGALLLGTSETTAGVEELYETLDKKNRIFRRFGPTRHPPRDFPRPPPAFMPAVSDTPKSFLTSRATLAQMTQQALLDTFGPAAVTIDRQCRIVYFHGHTERYLDQPRGEPTRDVTSLARETVRGAVRTALQRAMADESPVTVRAGLRETAEGAWRIEVGVKPLDSRKPATHFLVTFEERKEPLSSSADTSPATSADPSALEQELQRTRDELQRTIEELQTSNEELKASNEEAMSINEELQSTNEELETSKEELQSLNEELTTTNAQLQMKMSELEASTSDLSSLLSSTNIAVIFLDLNFRVRRFTPAVKDLVELIPSDIGRPLSDLARKFSDAELLSDAKEVLEKLVPKEREIASESGRIYLRRALPYRTTDNRIHGVVVAFLDIGDRKQAEADLVKNEAQNRLILEGIREYAIFLLDATGRIATWPAGAERIFGFTAAEAIGQTLGLVGTPEDQAEGASEKYLARAEAEGAAPEERWHQRNDGGRFWGSGMLYAVKDGDKVTGYVKVLRDDTNRKRGEEALLEAKHTAEQANEAKDQFLANVSHELRTPLSAMLLWAKMLLQHEQLTPEMEEGLKAIEKCAVEQQALIEDIVDTSRIVAGKLRLELKAIELTPVLHSAVEAIRPAVVAKNLTITENYGPDIGQVNADSNRLHQVVWNLLINAVKFTPSGGRIDVRMRRDGEVVEIEVADTGAGIAVKLLPKIFERFRQAENATTRSHSGLGLGLSIARELVELHGGTLAARSDGADRGSVFTVGLPLPLLGTAAWTTEGSTPPMSGVIDLTGLHVLLVEDSPETRQAVAALLRKAGANVTVAETAARALQQLQHERPDVLLSDLGLPEMDGHTLIRKVREVEKTQDLDELPAFALTAYADEKNHKKALENGFKKCLTKPVDAPRLLSALAKVRKPRSQSVVKN